MEGRTISHYRLIRCLGSGGMGEVWLAEDTRLSRRVALKFLSRDLARDHKARTRLVREAKAVAQLDHPNIVPIHEIGEEGEELYLVMAYMGGGSLRDRLEQRTECPISLTEIYRWGIEAAEGLAEAHRRGVIHRDIKPDNLMLDETGRLRIADFGLARMENLTRVTREGTTLGTPGYMSPEQLKGEQADSRSDLYSLGATLYELLAERKPFAARDQAAALYAIVHSDPPALTRYRPEIPAEFSALVHRLLEKEPDRRPNSAQELSAQLQRLSGLSLPAKTLKLSASRTTSMRRKSWFAVAALLMIVIGLWSVMRPDSEEQSSLTDPTSSHTSIAVFPFGYKGGETYRYLSEGMVDLLGVILDGAGELRTLDAYALLKAVQDDGGGDVDPERGHRIARSLGADLYVTGRLIEAGGILQATAELFDREGHLKSKTQVRLEDGEDVFHWADDIAVKLLQSLMDKPSAELTRLALLTSDDPAALKEYLKGEEVYRRRPFSLANVAKAQEHFQNAIDSDSTFALASYRMGQSADWLWEYELARESLLRAARHDENLPPHVHNMIAGSLAASRGDIQLAEEHFERVLQVYPRNMEALYGMATIRFMNNPYRGRSIQESREFFDRIRTVEPDHEVLPVYFQFLFLCAGDGAGLDSLFAAKISENPSAEGDYNAISEFTRADKGNRAALLTELRESSPSELTGLMLQVEPFPDNLANVRELGLIAIEKPEFKEQHAYGLLTLARVEAGMGRWRSARQRLDALAKSHRPWALEYRALSLTMPFLPIPEAEREEMVSVLKAWQPEPTDANSADLFMYRTRFAPHDQIHAHLRAYLLGLLNAQLDRSEVALGWADSLRSLDPPEKTGTLVEDLAAGIEAEIAMQEDRPQEALDRLSGSRRVVRASPGWGSSFCSESRERYLEGMVLQRLGRLDEALGWFATVDECSEFDLIYTAPAHYHRAEIYERLGQPKKAAEQYERFVALWGDCDPELRDRVLAASNRLVELRAAPPDFN